MIVTVTPAPAIDWTIQVDSFELGMVNRAENSSSEPSGKGVNISWALHHAGQKTRAALLAGGAGGRLIEDALTDAGIDHVITDSGRDVRTNITLVTSGVATKINETAQEIPGSHLAQFWDSVISVSGDATAVLICGSLPRGVPATFVRDLVRELRSVHGQDLQVVVDSSRQPLELALEAHPDLIKPNVHELADLVGMPIATFGDVVAAAQEARAKGARAVLASLGPDGVLLVDPDGVLYAQAEKIPVVNSVGAGDALLAGFFGRGGTRQERLANAVLWASSAVAHQTTLFPIRQEFASMISVDELSTPGQPLSEASVPSVLE